MTGSDATKDQAAPYDAVVIGGSFAGLSAAIQLARARRRVLVLDGGKPRNRFAKAAHGFFGHDGRPPREMIEAARRQVLAYPTVEFRPAEATDADREGGEAGPFRVAFGEGREARTRRIVLATGVVDHLPDVPGLRELWGEGVAHCPYCHGYEVAGRPLAVLAGALGVGPAVHQAALLRDWSEEVTLLTNGAPAADLTDEQKERLRARGVKVETARLARLLPEREGSRALGAVEFADGRRVPFGGLFTAPRVTLAAGNLAARLGCETEDGMLGPMLKTDAMKQTSVPGVYAAGDAARAMHNVAFASADGAQAGSSAHQSMVFPKQP